MRMRIIFVMHVRRIGLVSEYGVALGLSFFFVALFIGGFWLGVHWQIGRDHEKKTHGK
tara:strand:- start:276 stop:449 length:174 start_codon:yes stop_codon:yes gene_type:complete